MQEVSLEKSKKLTPTWSKSLIVLVASGIVPSSPSPLPPTPLSRKSPTDVSFPCRRESSDAPWRRVPIAPWDGHEHSDIRRTESSLSLIESPQIPLLSAVATVVRCSCCLLLLSVASTATAAVVCSTVHCRSQHCHDVAAVYSTVESSSAVRNVHRYCHSQH
ncbi:hypothetical protein B296_00010467 [Ensete ventricosum]|uniref:Uncharacterized protein n=1 Tax=Ensete ventricosum TaxID=4639 RepID=A0A426ZWZ0_ENSVE|nr:hypothetical protein B296_00010467 [Ensete ventricosum]